MARANTDEDVLPYYPPRARWYARVFYLGNAIRRRFWLDRIHLQLPQGITFGDLHDPLRAHGFVVYAGQGRLASEVFRISCMGALEPPVLLGLESRLAEVLQAARVPA